MSSNENRGESTPIFLHPARRLEMLNRGIEAFNSADSSEGFTSATAHWTELLAMEQGRDQQFVQALLRAASHFGELKKRSPDFLKASESGSFAQKNLSLPVVHSSYRELDVTALQAALIYNLNLLNATTNKEILVPESFLYPKLFTR